MDSALFVVANMVKEQEEKEAIENGIPEDEVSVTDSLKAIYTHSSSDIAIEVYTYRSQGDHDTTYQQILLNANLLPTSYTAGEREERYSYDAENRLASLELYDNNTLTRKLC